MKVLSLFLLCISITYSFDGYCSCGPFHAFNQDTYTCDQYPNKNEEGYIEGCKQYSVQRQQQIWKCMECEPQFMLEFGYCIDTGIPGCIKARQIQNLQKNPSSFLSSLDQGYKCQECDKDNYYLHNHQCIKFPTQGDRYYIKGCKTYFAQGKCLECEFEQGYYRDHFYCQKLYENKIENCKNQANEICMDCDYGYALKSYNQCVKTQDIIPNCNLAFNFAGTYYCMQCNPGYLVNQDRTCQPYPTTYSEGKIDNCIDYKLNDNFKLQCYMCDSDHSLSYDYNSCQILHKQSSIDNCLAYQDNLNGSQVCTSCSEYSNAQFEFDFKIQQCKKCPSVPKIQLNQENIQEVSQQYGFNQALLDIFNRIKSLF